MGVGTAAFGLVVGCFLGAAQGGLLLWYIRRYLPYLTSGDRGFLFFGWMLATVLGLYLCVGVVFALRVLGIIEPLVGYNQYSAIATLYVIGGTLFGLSQWIVLRWFVRNAWWWVIVSAIGWGLGSTIGRYYADEITTATFPDFDLHASIILNHAEYLNIFVEGVVGTAIFGLVSATAIALLLSPKSIRLLVPPSIAPTPPQTTPPS
jgi:hypothetical protein